VQGGPLSWCK